MEHSNDGETSPKRKRVNENHSSWFYSVEFRISKTFKIGLSNVLLFKKSGIYEL